MLAIPEVNCTNLVRKEAPGYRKTVDAARLMDRLYSKYVPPLLEDGQSVEEYVDSCNKGVWKDQTKFAAFVCKLLQRQ